MQATPAIDMRENRPPISRQLPPSCTRASAETKAGMPPIQIAAPSWCMKLTASRGAWYSRRAAACVVRVAAPSSTRPAPSRTMRDARSPQAESVNKITPAQPILTRLATTKVAPATSAGDKPTVSTRTAPPSATVSASHTMSAAALQAAIRTVSRRIAAPAAPSIHALGRARNTRKMTPPSVIDCATMVSPWMTMLR